VLKHFKHVCVVLNTLNVCVCVCVYVCVVFYCSVMRWACVVFSAIHTYLIYLPLEGSCVCVMCVCECECECV